MCILCACRAAASQFEVPVLANFHHFRPDELLQRVLLSANNLIKLKILGVARKKQSIDHDLLD